MNRLTLLYLSVPALLLAACATPQEQAEGDPADYGMFVATTNIAADSKLVVQREGQDPIAVRISHTGGDVGYAMAALRPGRYYLMTYSPDGRNNYPITTDNGWFEVQAGCFNYGGDYQFSQDDAGPRYTNKTTLADIQGLPGQYKDQAKGKDICDAGMGRPSERLRAEDVAKVMPDL